MNYNLFIEKVYAEKVALITGITGMVGSHLTDYLLKNTDWFIYGLCRWRSPFDNIKHLIPRIEKKERIDLLYGDLNDYVSAKAIEVSNPNYIFHLAAQSYPKTSFDSPIDTLNTNILGTAKLLEAIKKNATNKPVVFMFVHHPKFLEEFQEKNCQLMKNALSILHHLMLFQKLEQTYWEDFMERHLE